MDGAAIGGQPVTVLEVTSPGPGSALKTSAPPAVVIQSQYWVTLVPVVHWKVTDDPGSVEP